MHKIFLQIAVQPFIIAIQLDSELQILKFDNQQDFRTILDKISLTKDTHFVVNRGPGSYAGIRMGLAYILGLIDGGLIPAENVNYVTTFDIVQKQNKPIFLKSWPKLDVDFSQTKGYLFDGDVSNIVYIEASKLPANTVVLLESDNTPQGIPETMEILHLSKLLDKTYLFETLQKLPTSTDDTPLYINPVHITQ